MGIYDSTPSSYLWVSTAGDNNSDGSMGSPLATIQEALDQAAPGTAILVQEGDYRENVKFPRSGTEDAPIWLVSVDGPGKATITPQNENVSTVLGRGTDNIAVKDFAINGADNANGIEFTQSGIDFTNLVKNILIEGNTVYEAGIDGIKIAQTENIDVIGNLVIGGKEEGIDFVTVWNGTVAQNEVRDVQGTTGISIKGGSNNLTVEQNYVHDVAVDGISIGGWTDANLFQIFDGFEASNITVQSNYVENVEKRPLNFLAAQDSIVTNNFLDPNNDYFTIVNIEGDNNGFVSRNLTITDNTVTKEDWLHIAPGHDKGHAIDGNEVGYIERDQVGLDAYEPSNLIWLSTSSQEPEPEPSDPDQETIEDLDNNLVAGWQFEKDFQNVSDAIVTDHQDTWQIDQGTIEFTFSTKDPGKLQGLVSKDASFFGNGGHLTAWVEDDKLIVRLQDDAGSYFVETAKGDIDPDVDHLVAISFGDNGLKLYLDGTLIDENPYTGGLGANMEPFVFGASAVHSGDGMANNLANPLDGSISNVSLFNLQTAAPDEGGEDVVTDDRDDGNDDPTEDVITAFQINQAFSNLGDALVADHQDSWSIDQGSIDFTFKTLDPQKTQGIVSKDALFFGNGGHFTAWIEDSKLIVRLQDEGESYIVQTETGSIERGVDNDVTVSFGDNGLKLFFNGALVDSNPYKGGLGDNEEPFVFGASAVYSDDESANKLAFALEGSIGDVTIRQEQTYADDSIDPDTGSGLVSSLQLDLAFNEIGDSLVLDHEAPWQIDEGSIEFVFSTSDPGKTQGIISKDAYFYGSGGHFTSWIEDEKLIVRLQSNDASHTVETARGSLQSDIDNHAIVSFGEGGLKLIFNGELADTNPYTGGIGDNEEPLVLGASAAFSDDESANDLRDSLDGTIKSVAIYDRAVSDDALAIIVDDQFTTEHHSLLDVFDELSA